MKRLLTTGLVLLAISGATASFAQGKRTYDDDIYSDSKSSKATKQEQPAQSPVQNSDEGEPAAPQSDRAYSSKDGDSYDARNNTREYADDYADYENDYYYSSRISRFYYPFYNRPYYSSFYNPYWYDPYWVDPYWGWSPWTRPGFSISFGAGPYWSSYGGWSSWYGCGNFSSYYGYPGYSMYGGYYSGYWNGYYAGLYNNYGYGRGYRAITYGPRYSLNATNNHFVHNIGSHGFRRELPAQQSIPGNGGLGSPRSSGFRTTNGDNDHAVRESSASRDNRQFRSNDASYSRDRGEVRASENDRRPVEAPRNNQMNGSASEGRGDRGGWFGRSGRSESPAREQRSFSQPRSESAPSRSFGGNGGRSFGGSSGGGRSFGGSSGGGRSFGGGRR